MNIEEFDRWIRFGDEKFPAMPNSFEGLKVGEIHHITPNQQKGSEVISVKKEDELFTQLVRGIITENDYNHRINLIQYQVGVRVVANRKIDGNVVAKGTKGTIRHISGQDIGVEWDEIREHTGHSLQGYIKNERGWYTQPEKLNIINEENVGSEVENEEGSNE